MTVMEWLSCLWKNLMHMSLWYLYVYVTPFPNGYLLFQPFIQFLSVWIISGLVKSVFERSLSGKKSQFLSKSGFVVTLEFIFYNLGTFWVLTDGKDPTTSYTFLMQTGSKPGCYKHHANKGFTCNMYDIWPYIQ